MTFVFNSLSPWYFLLCILGGLAYSGFLYARNQNFSLPVRLSLATLRVVIITLLLVLLLNPLFKNTAVLLEKPVLVIAQDHSSSINAALGKGSANAYQLSMLNLQKQLGQHYIVKSYSFGTSVREGLDFKYTDRATDFSSLLAELSKIYENQNLGAVIIASDGIYNRGPDPVYAIKNFHAPFYTIALGDSIQAKDLSIDDIDYNNLVYQGDKFQLKVNIQAHQLQGHSSRITVRSAGKVLYSSPINIKSSNFISQIPLFLDAGSPGFRKITVTLEPVPGEMTLKNNEKTIVVEVIKGKLKILLVSGSPHPDLSAVKQSLETFRNDEVVLKIVSQPSEIDTKGYDLVILDQLPTAGSAISHGWSAILDGKIPVWFIIGSQTDVVKLNAIQKGIFITPGADLSSELLTQVSPVFNAFVISDSLKSSIDQFPPLLGPSAYQTFNESAVVFRQPQQNALKAQPLLFVTELNDHKTGYLMGSGIWRWRLADFLKNNNHHATNELFGKFVQFLTAKKDKRRFRISMPERILNEDVPIVFDGFLFNESYEPVTSADVMLEAVNSAGKTYRFVFSKTGSAYRLEIASLPVGDYSYHASVSGMPKLEASGKFVIKPLLLEELTQTANHNLLYQLAFKTGGKMVYPASISSLPALIQQNELIKMQSHEVRSVSEFISIRLLAFLLLILLSLEWGIRKWNGVY